MLADHLTQAPLALSQLSFQSQVPSKQLLLFHPGNSQGLLQFGRTLLGSTNARGELAFRASE